ncbi:hypothetical protein GCM10029992_09000 [Glycomyces albus]
MPVKRRFDEADTGRMLREAWWDWPVEVVTEHVHHHVRHPDDVEAVAESLEEA